MGIEQSEAGFKEHPRRDTIQKSRDKLDKRTQNNHTKGELAHRNKISNVNPSVKRVA